MIFYQILLDNMGEFAHGHCGLKGLIKAFLGIMLFFLFYLFWPANVIFFIGRLLLLKSVTTVIFILNGYN